MNDSLRVVLIGAGRMGKTHLAALDAAQKATVVAVVDPVLAAREAMAARGLETHATVEEAVDAGGFDAAVVAAPSDLHLPIIRTLAAAGKHILCEKPCGLHADEAAEAGCVAEAAGLVLQIGYWRRFVPELARLRERIAAGDLGELSLVHAWQWDGEPPTAEFRQRSGGIVRDMGVHEIDQTRWLTGQNLEVTAALESSVISDSPVAGDPESIAVLASLSGGGVAVISVGRRYVKGDSCWAEVVGTRDAARSEFMVGAVGDPVFRQALVDQIDAFADAVRGEAQRGATADDAAAALTVAARTRSLQVRPRMSASEGIGSSFVDIGVVPRGPRTEVES